MTMFYLISGITNARPGVIIFPNMHTLGIVQMPAPIPNHTNLVLFPSSLRHLDLSFGYPGFIYDPMCGGTMYLLEAARQVSKLERLSLAGSLPRTALLCVMLFKELHTLDLFQVGLSDVRGTHIFRDLIGAFSSMKQLIKLLLPYVGLSEEGIPQCKGFQNLESLTVAGPPMALSTFLRSLSTRTLQDVTLDGTTTPQLIDVAEWQDCVACLCLLHGSSLRAIDLRLTASTGGHDLSRMGVVSPILELHHIERFTIYCPGGRLSVNDIQTMALAWPNIQVLRLSLDVSADETMANNLMSTAFHCLIPLARQCRKLTTLDLRLIGRVLPDMATWPTLHRELVNLDLDVPHIIKPKPIARMLHRIFPALVEVKAEGASDSIGRLLFGHETQE
jgi:hypothetical protein